MQSGASSSSSAGRNSHSLKIAPTRAALLGKRPAVPSKTSEGIAPAKIFPKSQGSSRSSAAAVPHPPTEPPPADLLEAQNRPDWQKMAVQMTRVMAERMQSAEPASLQKNWQWQEKHKKNHAVVKKKIIP